MENDKTKFKNYATDDGESIFDKQTGRNQVVRERQIRILRLILIGVAVLVLVYLVYRLTVFGANTARTLIGQIEQPTATATIDLSLIIAASPTPPATSTVLSEWTTFEQELPTIDPNDPDAGQLVRDPEATETPEPTRRTGAIFFTPEPTITPTPTNTPLPTAEIGNFARNEDAPALEAEVRLRDPRCAEEATEADYVFCMVRIAVDPIEP